MKARLKRAGRATTAGALSALLCVGVVIGLLPGTARADSAPADPSNPATPATVTADGLPTVQIDGVVWAQTVVGNTVYAAGKFSKARPAGAPAGTQETTRNNLLAYDIRTGNLVTSFAPDLNGQALTVTASPDGSRIYVGGDFTTADGQPRYRIAAYSTATGQLVPNFAPIAGYQVDAIVATDTTVYLGGGFKSVNGAARASLAAVNAADGALLPWAPQAGPGVNVDGSTAANYSVLAMVLADGGSKVVVGGRFGYLNGTAASGLGALDPATGATLPFPANQLITNQGDNSAIYSLSTDGTNVYASGYDYYGPGDLEGVVAANASTGELVWEADCHGDTYSTLPMNGALYLAGHPHVCSNIGGFPESNPRKSQYALAESLVATGKVGTATVNGHSQFIGQPAPSVLNWFPTLLPGSFTGQGQAGWSVTGNSQYIAYGGEFPGVNNKAQQGLVRFAVPSIAPNKIGPDGNAGLTPTVASFAAGTARVSWSTTTDRDNLNLTYSVFRSDKPGTPVYQTTVAGPYRQGSKRIGFLDTGLTNGASYSYSVTAKDPFGNSLSGSSTAVTVASSGSTGGAYASTVRADGATDYWRLGDSGNTAYDYAGGGLDMTLGSGVTTGQAGALTGDSDGADAFNGTSSGLAATQMPITGPQTFSIEAFVQTKTKRGGKIIGFGNQNSGTSSSYDRHLYLDNSGFLYFGVYPGVEKTIRSTNRINDGHFHHIVATLSSAGMALYVDGNLVASDPSVTSAQVYDGYWRIGGDKAWDGTGQWFNGTVDEVAIYPTALTGTQVSNHYTAATTGKAVDIAPTASFVSSTVDLQASFDASGSTDPDGTVTDYGWDYGDGTSGSGMTASHSYSATGTYPVTLTVTDDAGVTGTVTHQVTVTAPPPNVAPSAAFTATSDALALSVDGSTSVDSDGSVAAYAWDFGDGASGSGVTASHTYAAAGTYTVSLTVTDNDGATGTASKQVTVTTAPAVIASDSFERSLTGGWGTADTGGAWTIAGGAANAAVSGGVGQLTVAPGKTVGASLPFSAQDVSAQVDMVLPSAPTGGGSFVSMAVRRIGTSDYRAKMWFSAKGVVQLSVERVVSGAETALQTVTLPGSYTAGQVLRLRVQAVGSGTTTLQAKAWPLTGTEPADWQASATDDTAALQAPGGLYLLSYTSGSATAANVVTFDGLAVLPEDRTGTAG